MEAVEVEGAGGAMDHFEVTPEKLDLEESTRSVEMVTEMDEHEYCIAGEKVFSNELIVAEILKSFRKVEDLKVIRTISKVCCRKATELMAPKAILKSSRLEYMKMKFKEEGMSEFGFLDTYFHKYLVFAQLNSLLLNSDVLPFQSICIHSYMWDLKNPEVIKFFQNFGKRIKTVIFGNVTLLLNRFRELLLVRLIHAEEIIIHEEFNVKPKPGSGDIYLFQRRRKKAVLPKLKIIRIRKQPPALNFHVLEDLINAAVNLELVDAFIPKLYPVIDNANKASAVKTLEISSIILNYAGGLSKREGLGIRRLIVKRISAGIDTARKLLQNIIDNSKDCLEAIEFDPAIVENPYHPLRLPALGSVCSLNLTHLYRIYREWIFVSDTTAAAVFPNVKKVVVDKECVVMTRNFREMSLYEDNDYKRVPMPSVKVVCLKNGMFSESTFVFLESKFPNSTKFRVDFTGQLHREKWKIWSLPKQVETLELHAVWLEDFANYKLDEFFTGIPSRVCAIMQNLPAESIDFSRFQKKDSIESLKNLKHLTFYCTDVMRKRKTWEDENLRGIPYASKLSRQFVATYLPNLRVKFVFPRHYCKCLMTRECRGLREIESFATVTFKHEPFC